MEHDHHGLNLLAAYVDGRLDSTEREQLTAHLASCRQCRTTVAALVQMPNATVAFRSPAGGYRWLTRTPVWLSAAAVLVLATVAIMGGLRLPTADVPGAPSSPTDVVRQAPRTPPEAGIQLPTRRTVEGKTFRFVASEWVDDTHDPLKGLPEVEVRSEAHRAAVLDKIPELRPFAALGTRVIVVYRGTVYKFGEDPLK
jgi:hypothetical protein